MLQPSFFEAEECLKKLDQLGDQLKAINEVVDWSLFHRF